MIHNIGVKKTKNNPSVQKHEFEDMWISIFFAMLKILAKMWKKHKCPTIDEWIKKL